MQEAMKGRELAVKSQELLLLPPGRRARIKRLIFPCFFWSFKALVTKISCFLLGHNVTCAPTADQKPPLLSSLTRWCRKKKPSHPKTTAA
ncbi:Fe2OG dioxygenase domain-containing protein [Psidium guajava]|nr:Fe2OG dioxygenase domain-containing protein [Psidium guajava]